MSDRSDWVQMHVQAQIIRPDPILHRYTLIYQPHSIVDCLDVDPYPPILYSNGYPHSAFPIRLEY